MDDPQRTVVCRLSQYEIYDYGNEGRSRGDSSLTGEFHFLIG